MYYNIMTRQEQQPCPLNKEKLEEKKKQQQDPRNN